ncbi:MAG: hypothetical protein HFH88_15295 [Lachnospiraceae bacterium]|jgi:hypothetical protein|nr:hypothetical protein [Lachnospiraceae bacterium]
MNISSLAVLDTELQGIFLCRSGAEELSENGMFICLPGSAEGRKALCPDGTMSH